LLTELLFVSDASGEKKGRTAAFGSEKPGSGGKRALLFGKRSKYLLRKE